MVPGTRAGGLRSASSPDTHYAECWREHAACAARLIEVQRDQIERMHAVMARMNRLGNLMTDALYRIACEAEASPAIAADCRGLIEAWARRAAAEDAAP